MSGNFTYMTSQFTQLGIYYWDKTGEFTRHATMAYGGDEV